jgi:hypothetical protein
MKKNNLVVDSKVEKAGGKTKHRSAPVAACPQFRPIQGVRATRADAATSHP